MAVFNTVNTPDIVKKLFEMYYAYNFNLSYQSLTSYAAREKLRNLKNNEPEFWDELTRQEGEEKDDGGMELDDEARLDGLPEGDDTDVPCSSVVADILSGDIHTGFKEPVRALTSKGEAKTMDFVVDMVHEEVGNDCENLADAVELGWERRKKKTNSSYSHSFWYHHNDDKS
ncbi:uncharacterized protein BJ212DRAFT_1475451 [Suillus subaureus]|uniref:Uncharacterized protein n=1 Tax=Suillus subaureus TaxID=48587 RepID=A0A9P7EMR6_9AGAM|nr:uncharacterized protein BJ212DRAFT_1475451 [Suillus subaureus]KAG1826112.1 hypothetical protein BJ212DRAFT_1475451 [Suillus subaureus]